MFDQVNIFARITQSMSECLKPLEFIQALQMQLQKIEKVARVLDSSLNAECSQVLPPFLIWVREYFVPSETEMLSKSQIVRPKNYIGKMAQFVGNSDARLSIIAKLLQKYCQMIDSNINADLTQRAPYFEPETLPLILNEIESEMKSIGYWSESPISSYDLEDPRFLAADKYLQFIFIPKELKRSNEGELSASTAQIVWEIRCDLIQIPKAKRLLELLNRYVSKISDSLSNVPKIDLNFSPIQKKLWIIKIGETMVQKAFEEVFADLQTKVKIPGYKRGQAPFAALKANYALQASRDALCKLIQQQFYGAVGIDWALRTEVLCTIAPIIEGKDLCFFVYGYAEDGLPHLWVKSDELMVSELWPLS